MQKMCIRDSPDPDDPDVIVIRTDYSYSEISFNPLNIIELSVTNTATNNVEFYLHFQMNTCLLYTSRCV